MIPLPCKENKCLLYPACASKRDINCDLLRTYYHRSVVASAEADTSDPTASQTMWEVLKNVFPNMSSLKGKIIQ
jgi:hypothetical protein